MHVFPADKVHALLTIPQIVCNQSSITNINQTAYLALIAKLLNRGSSVNRPLRVKKAERGEGIRPAV